ncbi:F-box protein At5g51370-like [Gossypium arboreum]|uniref:F-box domain-containing protein n=2 Tax=Gossypium tomentosum TaxID=34277 RepID=A0A5D2MVC4_GOSTO|nr:F-box protein At5g51370-like [Gossypium arboreum]TYH95517.1 hypothetical protein ES332_A12G111100v1 [Gossypium tomentosum]
MSQSPESPKSPNTNPNPNSDQDYLNLEPPPSLKSKWKPKALSLPDIWVKEQALKHVIYNMQQQFSRTPSSSPPSEPDVTSFQSFPLDPIEPDYSSLLSDVVLLGIFSKLPVSQHVSNSLVCKRWLYLTGRLVQSLKVKDWSFISSGRVFNRFPNLTDLDLVGSCIQMPKDSGVLVTHKTVSVYVDTSSTFAGFLGKTALLPLNVIDTGLAMVAEKYPNLRRLVVIGASEEGLRQIAVRCYTLQELELHCCGDLALKGISGIKNLQVMKLIGSVNGFYYSTISDIGLTLLAQGCKRLVKLELCGCEGSYDGVKAIGQCCQMLEELSFYDHRMDGGWLAGLSYCSNLKTLKLKSCKSTDTSPGADEHLGTCLTLEELHLQQCHIRDKQSVKALFLVCENVRAIDFRNCWGLDDDVFSLASICRRVKVLSVEGCSLLTIKGLESVLLSWKELQQLRVMSCNNIKDTEVTPELATLFSMLKELKWRPDSQSLLLSNLVGTGMGKKGGRFFQRSKD